LPDVAPGNRLEFQIAGGASTLEILRQTIRPHTQELSRLCHRFVASLTAGFIPCFFEEIADFRFGFHEKLGPIINL
jgi:hypothetical protein